MSKKKCIIGVLALQGAFSLHKDHIEKFECDYKEVVTLNDLNSCDGLIIPGGESGVMLKLIDERGMSDALSAFVRSKPVWGICAGSILLAHQVSSPTQKSFDAIDVDIVRNGYGRQNESFETTIEDYTVSFIRAPIISRIGDGVTVVNSIDGKAVAVTSKNVLLTTFHPELSMNFPSVWHRRFVSMCNLV